MVRTCPVKEVKLNPGLSTSLLSAHSQLFRISPTSFMLHARDYHINQNDLITRGRRSEKGTKPEREKERESAKPSLTHTCDLLMLKYHPTPTTHIYVHSVHLCHKCMKAFSHLKLLSLTLGCLVQFFTICSYFILF